MTEQEYQSGDEVENEEEEEELSTAEPGEETPVDADLAEMEDDEELDLRPNLTVLYVLIGLLAVLIVGAVVWFVVEPDFSPVVLTVNGERLRGQQLEDQIAFEYVLQTGGQPLAQSGITSEQFGEFARDNIIDGMIIGQKAEENDIAITDEELTAEENRIFGIDPEAESETQSEPTPQQEEFYILVEEAVGLAPEQATDLLRHRLLVSLQARALMESLDLPVDETQEVVNAAHILVTTEEEMDAVIERLDGGEDFAEVALDVSIDSGSAQNGGELGFFPRGMMVGPFEEVAFATEPGEISEPFQTQFGWHVIKVIERDEMDTSDQQRAEQRQTLFRDLVADWRVNSEIVIEDNWREYLPTLP